MSAADIGMDAVNPDLPLPSPENLNRVFLFLGGGGRVSMKIGCFKGGILIFSFHHFADIKDIAILAWKVDFRP